MYKQTKKHRRPPIAARVIAGVVLAWLFVPFLGVPLSTSLKKDRSVPFPCQNRSCGCMSATDCKHGCCCFSASERREWARQRGIEPSNLVLDDETSANRPSAIAEPSEANVLTPEQGCCCLDSCDTTNQHQCCKSQDTKPENDALLLWQARHCHGDDGTWFTLVLMMPSDPIHLPFPDNIFHFLSIRGTDSAKSRGDEPDDPVPWTIRSACHLNSIDC